MEIEIYRKKGNPLEGRVALREALVEIKEEVDTERIELYTSLGFDGLARLSVLTDPADWYPELTLSQWATWASFLPTQYNNNGGWRTYDFDAPPIPILRELEIAKNLGFFSVIQIRTPEALQTDPVAIGYYSMPSGRDRHFLICRWGESLIPYWQVWMRTYIGWILLVCLFGIPMATILALTVAK